MMFLLVRIPYLASTVSLASAGSGANGFHTLVARDISARVEAERQIQTFAKGLQVSKRLSVIGEVDGWNRGALQMIDCRVIAELTTASAE